MLPTNNTTILSETEAEPISLEENVLPRFSASVGTSTRSEIHKMYREKKIETKIRTADVELVKLIRLRAD